jgi:hypothetical protein
MIKLQRFISWILLPFLGKEMVKKRENLDVGPLAEQASDSGPGLRLPQQGDPIAWFSALFSLLYPKTESIFQDFVIL